MLLPRTNRSKGFSLNVDNDRMNIWRRAQLGDNHLASAAVLLEASRDEHNRFNNELSTARLTRQHELRSDARGRQ